jgi:hypothetical protein
MKGAILLKAVEAVTGDWRKQRKREERGRPEVKSRRRRVMRCDYEYSMRVTIKEAAWECMEAAYMKASAGGTLPAASRQIMYAARPAILENAHDRYGEAYELRSDYFTQTLLPDYMAEHDCSGWDVVFDARGHLTEPHTNCVVPLGTLDVRDYLHSFNSSDDDGVSFEVPNNYPTHGPDNRFGAVLFIEKEGFIPLFEKVKLAERFDIAIMSTKGMTVTAARSLVEEMCGGCGVPLFILRDFDKAGFAIKASYRKDTRRYQYNRDFEVIDLGLRLADVEEHDLVSEEVSYTADPSDNLRENGATEEEIAFLCEGGHGKHYYGRRVELNAFASDEFVAWIESKLEQHGIKKLVPDEDTLRAAYARAVKIATINQAIEEAMGQADEAAETHTMPKGLARMIWKRLKDDPSVPWDKVVAEVVASKL